MTADQPAFDRDAAQLAALRHMAPLIAEGVMLGEPDFIAELEQKIRAKEAGKLRVTFRVIRGSQTL